LTDPSYQKSLEKNGFFRFPRTLEQIEKRIKETLLTLVAEEGNEVIGFIIVAKNNQDYLAKINWKNQKAKEHFRLNSSATIHLIAVDPGCQQKGIGWQLLMTAQEMLLKMGFTYLFSTIMEKPVKNTLSIDFHLKNSFVVVGKRKEIKDGQLSLRKVFLKKLDDLS